MPFVKGQSGNPKGRKPGAPNRVTKQVREALLEALNDGEGATAFFKKLKTSKKAEDRRVFANLCAKLIPTELTGAGGEPLLPIVDEPNLLEIARSVAFVLTKADRALTVQQDGTVKPDV